MNITTSYIHPDNEKIKRFAGMAANGSNDVEDICKSLLAWFDENVEYSRLNSPFFPLQRSDIDVLEMKSGTCGDYTNLLVSALLSLGYDAKYAYIHRDCYGDEQDHICAAVLIRDEWMLIDATQPYRKWHGFNCRHKDYELLTAKEFEDRMKTEEKTWQDVAESHNNPLLAGLLYAPWIHDEVICETKDRRDSVFFLLIIDDEMKPTLYSYYQRYTKDCGKSIILSALSKGTVRYQFSVNKANDFWDNAQWGAEYEEASIPAELMCNEYDELAQCVLKHKEHFNYILKQVGLSL